MALNQGPEELQLLFYCRSVSKGQSRIRHHVSRTVACAERCCSLWTQNMLWSCYFQFTVLDIFRGRVRVPPLSSFEAFALKHFLSNRSLRQARGMWSVKPSSCPRSCHCTAIMRPQVQKLRSECFQLQRIAVLALGHQPVPGLFSFVLDVKRIWGCLFQFFVLFCFSWVSKSCLWGFIYIKCIFTFYSIINGEGIC